MKDERPCPTCLERGIVENSAGIPFTCPTCRGERVIVVKSEVAKDDDLFKRDFGGSRVPPPGHRAGA